MLIKVTEEDIEVALLCFEYLDNDVSIHSPMAIALRRYLKKPIYLGHLAVLIKLPNSNRKVVAYRLKCEFNLYYENSRFWFNCNNNKPFDFNIEVFTEKK